MPLTFISLFAGIGGIDLGLERAGMRCVAQVEIDDYATRVLAKHWPTVRRLRDVRSAGAHNLPRADVIAGGFPCQDISNAGRRAGIGGERSGLWAEYARIVRELRPRYVLVENVAALLSRGVDRVLGDLAALGYDAERNGSAYQRRPLVRLTDVTDSSLWPTPVAHDDGKTPEAHMAMKRRMPGGPRQTITSLNVMVKAIEQGKYPQLWPTPRSSDADRGGRGDLIQAVRGNPNSHYRMYPTPTVPNGGRSPKGGMSLTGMTPDGKKRQVDLAHFVRQSDGISGQLNPTWVEWLMGFPLGWTDLKDSETP